jgi:hypothetical protein
LLHLAFSAGIAIVVYWFEAGNLALTQQGFLSVISAMGAVSGALLAVLIAISTFYAQFVTDRRDKLVVRLENSETKLRKQIETSAADNHPEISRHLGAIYDVAMQYEPGQKVNMDNVRQAANVFEDWAKAEVKTMGRPIDLGNIIEFSSLQLQLRDSHILVGRIKMLFWYLWASNNHISAISAMPSLILGCAVTVIFSLGLALLGAGGLITERFYLPALVIPFWLTIVVVAGCTTDFAAMLDIVQVQEKNLRAADEKLQKLKSKAAASDLQSI